MSIKKNVYLKYMEILMSMEKDGEEECIRQSIELGCNVVIFFISFVYWEFDIFIFLYLNGDSIDNICFYSKD